MEKAVVRYQGIQSVCRKCRKIKYRFKNIDFAVLSHAHYDHANGMGKFFEINEKAPFYLQEGCGENCYFKKGFVRKYIGIPKGITKDIRIESNMFPDLSDCRGNLSGVTFHAAFRTDREKRDDVPKDKAGLETG